MKTTLIICTYQRPKAILQLMKSVRAQTVYPDLILIVDGSEDERTKEVFDKNNFENLTYFKVSDEERGLTRQRNFGIARVDPCTEVVAFLDDDIMLDPDYFKALETAYQTYPDALGVGGYITNDVVWKKGKAPNANYFEYGGYYRKEGSRFKLRRKVGLEPDRPAGFLPEFSHGRSVSFLPPSGLIYEVEQFMGGVASYRESIFKEMRFSPYFEGYGLYEDADFTLRLSKKGKLYLQTAATCTHHHDASGRPDAYKYGKMVVRNGWYVWRVRWPKPSAKAKLKWHATSFLLTLIRYCNALTTNKKSEVLEEAWGRTMGWWGLLIDKPKSRNDLH